MRELDSVVDNLERTYRSFVRTRQAATQSYEGYDSSLNTLTIKVQEAQERVKSAMLRQGKLIEAMAVDELDKRRKRIEGDQVKARFALAESYDRAQKAQEDAKYKALAEKNAEKAKKEAEQAEKQAAKDDQAEKEKTGISKPEDKAAAGGDKK